LTTVVPNIKVSTLYNKKRPKIYWRAFLGRRAVIRSCRKSSEIKRLKSMDKTQSLQPKMKKIWWKKLRKNQNHIFG